MQLADEMVVTNRFISLIGPSKQGKTVCAASISGFFPDNFPSKEKVYLKDTALIQVDSNGVQSLRSGNVIPFVEDLSTLTTKKDLILGFNEAIKRIKEKVVSKEIKYVIFDTATIFCETLDNDIAKTVQDMRRWDVLKGTMLDTLMSLKSLPCTVVANMHTKYTGAFAGTDTPEAQARKRAGTMPGRAEISLSLPPSIAVTWRGAVDAQFGVYAVKEGKGLRHVILTQPLYGFEVGHRYNGLAEEEPAHLRKLLQKAGAY